MEFLIHLLIESVGKVWVTFTHNWPFLLASVLISVGLKLYIRPEKVSAFLTRYSKVGVLGATAAAVTTPFCSCGTTAVILGMVASTIPWSPIVAFMVASPLTSPQELIYSAGLFGWPFAIAFFVSSILLGLLGGAAAEFFESRGWLVNQARFALRSEGNSRKEEVGKAETTGKHSDCSCETSRPLLRRPVLASAVQGTAPAASCCAPVISARPETCGCSSSAGMDPSEKRSSGGGLSNRPSVSQVSEDRTFSQETDQPEVTLRKWWDEIYQTGGKLLLMFLGFAFLGYVLNGLIPQSWVTAIFGTGNIYSVPLAATLGLPLYINTEGSLPLVRALIDGGMSQGAALAFLITGAGTSIGAIGGALTIARWRVIALVVGTLWLGSILLGYAYNFLLATHLFG